MEFDAGLPLTGWGTTPATSPPRALSTSAPTPSGVEPGAGAFTSGPVSSAWSDAVTLGADRPGSSALFSPLGPDGTGVLYSPASVLGAAALAASTPDERDALGDVEAQAEVDSALLGQPAPDELGGLLLGATPTTGASALTGPTELTGLGTELSSADTGSLLALQDQWVGAGDGAARFSQWLDAFAHVAGRGGSGVEGALGLDLVV